jgi:flavin-dependent dehydrogenase
MTLSLSAAHFLARQRPLCCCDKIPSGLRNIDRGKICATHPTCRRGDGRGQRLLHGAGAGTDPISQRVASCEARAALWFTNDEVKSLDEASELGGHYQVRLPSYQLDRAAFDEEVLRRACAAGAELLRPASVTKVELSPGGEQTIVIRHSETTQTVRARWVVDASGVAALLARKEGWWRQNTEHPTAAAWSRWKGVKDWDSYELADIPVGFCGLRHSRHRDQSCDR